MTNDQPAQPSELEDPIPSPPPATKRSRRVLIVGAVVLVVVLLGGIAFTVTRPSKLEDASKACPSQYVELEDDGTAIVIGTPSEDEMLLDEDAMNALTDMQCVLKELDTPEYIKEQIVTTTSMMGRQEAEWDGLKASWSFHPDNGMNITIVKE